MMLKFENQWTENWGNKRFLTTIELYPGTDIAKFNEKITSFIREEHKIQYSSLFVQLFSDSYLKSFFTKTGVASGRIIALKIFILIALFTLEIACINFMNLSTARASMRMREIGVKKVVGVQRSGLVVQFLDESFRKQYSVDRLIGKLSLYFSTLAIFIACLGLLGLSAFLAGQRTKEIGIRKTFGASSRNMVFLLSGKFTRPLFFLTCWQFPEFIS